MARQHRRTHHPARRPGKLDIKSGNAIATGQVPDRRLQPRRPLPDRRHRTTHPTTYWHGLIHVQAEHAELHLIRPSYVDKLWDLFQHALAEWHALDEKRGWISHATDNVDRPLLAQDAA